MSGLVKLNAGEIQGMLTDEHGIVGQDLQRRVLRVHAAATRNCPVNSGRLRSSIRWTIGKTAEGLVGYVGTDVEYAIFVHEGTAPHEILPVNAQALYWPGAAHPVKSVQHPGTRAIPFLLDAIKEAA